jgi:hypothetical protein
MAEQQTTPIEPVPQGLSELIALNVRYRVLLCLGHGCRKAVSPAGIVEHLRKIHKREPKIRKEVEEYVQLFPVQYDYSSVPLPQDRLAPQPVVPVVDGLQCKECGFKTQSRSKARQHANKDHNQKRIADEELFHHVRMQSWFRDGKERYWIVDEGREGEQRENLQQSRTHQVLE